MSRGGSVAVISYSKRRFLHSTSYDNHCRNTIFSENLERVALVSYPVETPPYIHRTGHILQLPEHALLVREGRN